MTREQSLAGALQNLLDRVYQMRGMFPNDRALESAIADAEEALADPIQVRARDHMAAPVIADAFCPVCGDDHEPPVCNDDFPEPGDIRETGR